MGKNIDVQIVVGALFHELWKCTCLFLVTERSDLVNMQYHVTYVRFRDTYFPKAATRNTS